MKRVRLAIVIVMSFATLAVLSQFTYWGYRSPGFRSPDCDAPLVNHVKRKYFPLRHWSWSGIPVLEGGFIPDPHYICSTVVPVAEPVKEKLGSKDGEYAVIDVNPFFNDGTSEVLLLIQANGSKFEYSLSIPKGQNVQAVIASPTAPEAMLFPSGNDLVVLANFFGPAKGMYRLPLPLGHSGKLQFIPATSQEFSKIASTFKSVGHDSSTREQFCELWRSKPFISFYEKFAGPCEGNKNVLGPEEFSEFWLKG